MTSKTEIKDSIEALRKEIQELSREIAMLKVCLQTNTNPNATATTLTTPTYRWRYGDMSTTSSPPISDIKLTKLRDF
jgi:regulator of replication initiation timing